jgi:hypothetical protein
MSLSFPVALVEHSRRGFLATAEAYRLTSRPQAGDNEYRPRRLTSDTYSAGYIASEGQTSFMPIYCRQGLRWSV